MEIRTCGSPISPCHQPWLYSPGQQPTSPESTGARCVQDQPLSAWAEPASCFPPPAAPQQTQGTITLPFVVCNTGSVKFQEMQRRVISGTKARLLPSSCFQNESLNLPLPLLWHSPLHTTVGMRARSDRSLQEDLFYSPATDQVALWKTLYKQRLARLIPALRHLQ